MKYLLMVHRTVLLLYEYVITIEEEVNMIWKRKLKASSLLLLGLRWSMLLNAVFTLVIPINPQVPILLSIVPAEFNQPWRPHPRRKWFIDLQ